MVEMYCVTTNFLPSQLGKDHLEEQLSCRSKGGAIPIALVSVIRNLRNGAGYLKEDCFHSE